jgi:hypothetical protein
MPSNWRHEFARSPSQRKGWALSVAFMILCSSIGSVTAKEKKPTNAIRVAEATYGGNCTSET